MGVLKEPSFITLKVPILYYIDHQTLFDVVFQIFLCSAVHHAVSDYKKQPYKTRRWILEKI